jgi:hypothetical protein
MDNSIVAKLLPVALTVQHLDFWFRCENIGHLDVALASVPMSGMQEHVDRN